MKKSIWEQSKSCERIEANYKRRFEREVIYAYTDMGIPISAKLNDFIQHIGGHQRVMRRGVGYIAVNLKTVDLAWFRRQGNPRGIWAADLKRAKKSNHWKFYYYPSESSLERFFNDFMDCMIRGYE